MHKFESDLDPLQLGCAVSPQSRLVIQQQCTVLCACRWGYTCWKIPQCQRLLLAATVLPLYVAWTTLLMWSRDHGAEKKQTLSKFEPWVTGKVKTSNETPSLAPWGGWDGEKQWNKIDKMNCEIKSLGVSRMMRLKEAGIRGRFPKRTVGFYRGNSSILFRGIVAPMLKQHIT